MPYTIHWYDEITLLIQYVNSFNFDKTEEMLDAVKATISTQPQPIHIILDWHQAHGTPYERHQTIKRVVNLTHDHPATVAAVDTASIVSFWIDVMNQEKEHPYLACASTEEATHLLHLMDAGMKH